MVIVAPFCDTTDESEARAIFADFYKIGPVADMTKLHPYVEQNKIISSIQPHGPRTYMKGWGYQDMSVELLQHAYDRFSSYVSHIGADYQVSAIAYEATLLTNSVKYHVRQRRLDLVGVPQRYHQPSVAEPGARLPCEQFLRTFCGR
jgi:predicted anti-sigma-YlaC factor YlaD